MAFSKHTCCSVLSNVQGLLKSIGVSNFGIPHLQKLAVSAVIPPDVNQIELHPWLQRREEVKYCKDKGIVVEVSGTCLGLTCQPVDWCQVQLHDVRHM